jgi:hypothetical protein
MVMLLATMEVQVLCRFNRPLLRLMAKRIFETPCPMSSFTTYFRNSQVRVIPNSGYARYRKL